MRVMSKYLGLSVAMIAFSIIVHAQTVVFNGIGSSAQFLQLGLAAGTATTSSPAGLGATCVWSKTSGSAGAIQATDPTTGQPETGNAWIAFTPGSGGSCTSPGSSFVVYAMLQTDSVIGNRCFFNKCTLGPASTSPAGTSPDGLILGTGSEVALPSAVWNALNGLVVNVAATDIRPEDAKFATLRGLASCGAPVITGSQYPGLGYKSGTGPIVSYYSNSTFNVTDFTLPVDGSYTVIPLGAVPIVVAVNPSGPGFGAGVSDITPTTLSNFLSGVFGSTSDLPGAASTSAATVLVREPLSGTYNTMEYSIPNTTTNSLGTGFDLQTSQDVGLTQPPAQQNCDGASPKTTTNLTGTTGFVLHIPSADNSGAFRNRVIGTGQMVSELLNVPDAIGYAFWSTANFAAANSSNSRYLTVDSTVNGPSAADPLYDPADPMYATIKGQLPTAANGLLSHVTFTNLQDGSYPIWSLLRLVASTGDTHLPSINKLAGAAQGFVSQSTRPDFVPFNNTSAALGTLQVLHSHFAPPGVNFASSGSNLPANGASGFVTSTGASAAPACTDAEAGGDVGGVILTVSSDQTFCSSSTGAPAGQTGLRK